MTVGPTRGWQRATSNPRCETRTVRMELLFNDATVWRFGQRQATDQQSDTSRPSDCFQRFFNVRLA